MAKIDPEQERKRLTKLYAGQMNEELENAAAQSHELTEIARETLQAELTKRGLYIGQLDDQSKPPEQDEAEFRDLVTVRIFSTLLEAELAKGILDAAGIESFLFDENVGRIYLANVVGGFRLRVATANADEANGILTENDSGAVAPRYLEISDDEPAT
jgi:Putative prokaryotic signal transducing protein